MKVVFTLAAESQAAEIDAWWREHREKARDLFARELAEALALIEQTPTVGAVHPTPSGKAVRRIILPKTRHHIYFDTDERNAWVVILAVWGTPRGRGPSL